MNFREFLTERRWVVFGFFVILVPKALNAAYPFSKFRNILQKSELLYAHIKILADGRNFADQNEKESLVKVESSMTLALADGRKLKREVTLRREPIVMSNDPSFQVFYFYMRKVLNSEWYNNRLREDIRKPFNREFAQFEYWKSPDVHPEVIRVMFGLKPGKHCKFLMPDVQPVSGSHGPPSSGRPREYKRSSRAEPIDPEEGSLIPDSNPSSSE